jgi:PAS domain S-box-containing protein
MTGPQPVGVFIIDVLTNRFIDANPAIETLFGFSLHELKTMSLEDTCSKSPLVRDIPKRSFESLWLELQKNKIASLEWGCSGTNGDEHFFEFEFRVIPSPEGESWAMGILSDKLEKKRNQEVLRESEQRFKNLFLNNPLMLFALTLSGEILAVNDVAISDLGYAEKELLGKNVSLVFYKEDRPVLADHFNKFLSSRYREAKWELRKVKKTGEIIWVSEVVRHIQWEDNQSAILVACEDITERKIAQAALVKNEQKFKNLFLKNPLMLFALDKGGRILAVNNAAIRQLGYSKDELVGKIVSFVFLKEDRPKLEAHVKEYLHSAKEETSWELRKVKKNGEIIWVNEVVRYLDWEDEQDALLVSCEDITIRKGAELALQESERRFRSLSHNIPGVIYRSKTRANWEIIYITKQILNLTGYPQDSYLKGAITFEDIIHPDDIEYVKTVGNIEDGLHFNLEYRIIHRNGEVRWVQDIGSYVEDQKLGITTVDAVLIDITERKNAEGALKESENRYRNLFENNLYGIGVLDDSLKLINANSAFRRMLGYSMKELKKLHIHDLIISEFKSNWKEKFQKLLKREINEFVFEAKYLKKDSTSLNGVTAVNSVLGNDGEYLYATLTLDDVSEMRMTERSIREINTAIALSPSIKFFDTLVEEIAQVFDVSYVAIGELDESSRHVHCKAFWSNGNLKSHEYVVENSPCEVVYKTGKKLLIQEYLQDRFPMDSELEKLGVTSYFGLPLYSTNGKVAGNLVMMDNKPFKNLANKEDLLAVYSFRIGAEMERELNEAALSESEARYRLVFENGFDGILLYDLHLEEVISCNNQILELMKIDFQTLKKANPMDFLPVFQPSGALSSALLKDYLGLLSKQGRIQLEWEIINNAGEAIQFEVTSIRLPEPQNNVLVVIFKDVTHLKLIEKSQAELLQKQSELDNKNRELTSFTLYLTQKNQMLKGIHESLEGLKSDSSVEATRQIEKIQTRIIQSLDQDKEWKSFQLYFERVHPDFFKKIRNKFPQLSQNELKHLAYIKMKLSNKEVASLLYISPKAVEVARYRIKKKLGLQTRSQKLSVFVDSQI